MSRACKGTLRRLAVAEYKSPLRMATPVRRAFLVVLLVLPHGCQHRLERPALPTYPVRGKIVTSGTMPIGGCVQFEPAKNGLNYLAQGVIDAEGQFSLQVPYIDRVLPGATEGPHAVRVLLPLKQGGKPVPIEGTFLVEARENEFTIQMPNVPAM